MVGESTYIGRHADLYRSQQRPILVGAVTNIGQSSEQYRFAQPLFERPAKRRRHCPSHKGEDSGVFAFIRFTRQRRE